MELRPRVTDSKFAEVDRCPVGKLATIVQTQGIREYAPLSVDGDRLLCNMPDLSAAMRRLMDKHDEEREKFWTELGVPAFVAMFSDGKGNGKGDIVRARDRDFGEGMREKSRRISNFSKQSPSASKSPSRSRTRPRGRRSESPKRPLRSRSRDDLSRSRSARRGGRKPASRSRGRAERRGRRAKSESPPKRRVLSESPPKRRPPPQRSRSRSAPRRPPERKGGKSKEEEKEIDFMDLDLTKLEQGKIRKDKSGGKQIDKLTNTSSTFRDQLSSGVTNEYKDSLKHSKVIAHRKGSAEMIGDWPCPKPSCPNSKKLVFAKHATCGRCGSTRFQIMNSPDSDHDR